MDREARIKLIAEGASRAASDVRQVSGEVSNLGKVAGGVSKALKDIGASAYRAASDAARAMNDVRPISFSQAADSAKRFDDSVTRLAVRANRDVGQLKQQFRDTGKEIGVLPDRVAAAARALTKMTGSSDASDAIRDLGVEANDTDRSLEEMTEIGATLYNKLGVPMNRIGDTLGKLRTVAKDFQTVGGHVALEDTLVRLAPLLARFEGSVTRAAATVAVLGRGKSREVAEETSGSVLGTLEGLDPLLLTKKMREISGDRNYKPYTVDQQGRTVLKREVPQRLQNYLRKLPRSAVYGLFGRSMQGVQATETFLNTDLGAIPTEEMRIELEEDAAADAAKANRSDLTHRPGETRSSLPIGMILRAPTKPGSAFNATTAGRRAQTDVERADVELGVGDVIQAQRDKRNAAYAGNRGTQAAVDTLKQYLPSYLERPLDIAEAAGVEAQSHYQRSAPSGGAQPVTVNLSPASTKALADAIRSAPPIVRSGNGPAAQAVEDSKAKGRAAANY